MEWGYIEETLLDASLPMKMIDAIMGIIKSSRCCLLWNDELTKVITLTRGLQQGDPLSPLIFVLCIEFLSQWIHEKVRCGTWKALKVSRNGPWTSHLFFADDLLQFAEVGDDQIACTKEDLDLFCQESGQRMNNDKSLILFSLNISDQDARRISQALGIPITKDMGRYLGYEITHGLGVGGGGQNAPRQANVAGPMHAWS